MKSIAELKRDPDFTGRLLEWAMGDDRCASSLTLARAVTGMGFDPIRLSLPINSVNFGNCCRLLDKVPELRDHMDIVKENAPEWAPVIDNWTRLEYLYRNKPNEFSREIPFVIDESVPERKNAFSVFAVNDKAADGLSNVAMLSMHPFLQKAMHNALLSHPGGNDENRFEGLTVLFVPEASTVGFQALSEGVLKFNGVDVSPNIRVLSGIKAQDTQKFSMVIGPYPLEFKTDNAHIRINDKYHAGVVSEAPASKLDWSPA